ncbi:MAG TPA: patatin family protein [Spirochaetes bacterium]|nr:patatin family protein [Spirochaetota bacterium]
MIRYLLNRLRGLPWYKKKKVLVLEGGGMRGIFLTGVLQAFTDRGFFPWKLIIGSSAGALTGAAYAAGQIHIARDAFFTELLSGKFINITNILRPERHILNLDWMVDTIIKGKDPLDIRRLRRGSPVLITATDCRPDNPPEVVYLHSKKDDIFTALKATAAIPVLYRGFVLYKHYHFLDGGLLDPVPYRKALAMGFRENEILVVLTRPKGYRKREESFWIKSLYESYYREPRYRFLVEFMENRYTFYNRVLDELENKYTGIDVIYPPAGFRVDRLSRDERKILEGFEQGISVGRDYLRGIRI